MRLISARLVAVMTGRASGRHQVHRMAILAACIAMVNAASTVATSSRLGMREIEFRSRPTARVVTL